MPQVLRTLGFLIAIVGIWTAHADTLILKDGTTLKNCFVRDEGVRLTVWESLADVGKSPKVFPRTAMRELKVDRDAAWDRPPALPDLTITHLEIEPKLASLHGLIQYNEKGTPWIGVGSTDERPPPPLVDVGDRRFEDPNAIVEKLKLRYASGEELTVTAHVRNVGFKPAAPFELHWLLDGEALGTQKLASSLGAMEATTFQVKVKWTEGARLLTARIASDESEIASLNNELTDALDGWGIVLVVSKDRAGAWHKSRSGYGTFCLEDYCRWHIEVMNRLFEASAYPAAPQGIKARVRLDRIIYADRVIDNRAVVDGRPFSLFASDGLRKDQGAWFWNDDADDPAGDKGRPADPNERIAPRWSVLRDLGHQLGLVDWSRFDYAGDAFHVWPDNGEKITHRMREPQQMMYGGGPHLFGEVDAAYLNLTAGRPRGYHGDYLFAVPRSAVVILVRDINGRPLTGAKVEIFQRGVAVDPNQPAVVDEMLSPVTMHPVVEDGDFARPVSQRPVSEGVTNEYGTMLLSRRPVEGVATLNGFIRGRSTFGNIDVTGGRGLLLVRITMDGRSDYFWIESWDLVLPWFRGHRKEYVLPLQTTFASSDSPGPPTDVKLERRDEHHVKVRWGAPLRTRPLHPHDRIAGYRVYRRIGNDGLSNRPWFVVATLGPDAGEYVVDLRARPANVDRAELATERLGVTAIAATGWESELVGHVLKDAEEGTQRKDAEGGMQRAE